MILVLSEDKDYSTNQVLDWIKYFGKSYIRINGSNLITIKEIKITNTEVNVKFEVKLHNGEIIVVDSNEITFYWYPSCGICTPARLYYKDFLLRASGKPISNP